MQVVKRDQHTLKKKNSIWKFA